MIENTGFSNFRTAMSSKLIDPIDRMLVLGAGKASYESSLNARLALAIEWSNESLQGLLSIDNFIPLKMDIRDATKTLTPKSFNLAIMIDVIEHLHKKEAYILLKELEEVCKDQIALFVPIQPKMTDERIKYWDNMQRKHKKLNKKLNHHLSTWTPEEFDELGYDVEVSDDYHEKRGFGAMVCIKNLNK